MDRKQLYEIRKNYIQSRKYVRCYWDNYNYSILQNIMYVYQAGKKDPESFDDAIIMIDTETSKKNKTGVHENHVVMFTISIRAFDHNIVTLWGRNPVDLVECITRIMEQLQGDNTIMYIFNLSYDYVFIRRFLMQKYGRPVKQLNVKPHYPIYIKYNNGLILKDALILAGCKLEKWAKDLNVEHKKAVGKWDYNKIRTQHENYSEDELTYAEFDTLAGVECLQTIMNTFNKRIYSIPITKTAIPREQVRIKGKPNHAHDLFVKISPEYEFYKILEKVFHGGFTHADRHFIDDIIMKGKNGYATKCYDFTSSYPFCMLSEKYPMSKFAPFRDCSKEEILAHKDRYAFVFKLILYKFKLKDPFESMPVLQYSKGEHMINCVQDNGRILCGSYMEIYVTEQDLDIINRQYDIEHHVCTEVYYSVKDYLPRWFTDYVYELFQNKCILKGGDPVDYAMAKAILNSLYGMCVQKAIQVDILEDYETGEFDSAEVDEKSLYYDKYINNRNKVLPYQWGVYVTAYALHNLHDFFACVKPEDGYNKPIYSDTDSCYAHAWDFEKVEAYNQKCKDKLVANGYGAVVIGDKEYWLGVAESKDKADEYSQFKVMGAKRYCGRCLDDKKLHITVAGVPKIGAKCLKNNIRNFTKNFIFSGTKTGKKTHTYFFNDIYTDKDGNITGDSIDLSPCDYKLDSIAIYDYEKIFMEEIEVQTYEAG